MSEHLPVLLVVVPLIAAPISALVGRARGSWAVAQLAALWAIVAAIGLVRRVLAEGTIHYALGDWAAPIGIEYVVDAANAFVILIVAIIGALSVPYMRRSIESELSPDRVPLFYTAFLLCFAGLLGIAVTGDAFNLFVFLEISSLSTYVLVALGQDRRALTASYQYLIMGSIGATFIVIGIGLMYVMTGTLNMADLAQRLPAVADTRTIPVAFTFLTVGITLKLALFPLHLWLPNAYTYAPSAVTAFVAATATKVAVYMLLRFFFTVFGATFSFETMQLDRVIIPLAVVAVLTMSLVAVFEENAKRMLAYSSVAQVGYMILGIGLASVLGVTAGLLHIFNHALMKGALFMALGCVAYRVGSVRIARMTGLGRTMPWTMAAFVAAGLSLIGVPLTVGFISKWYLVQAALEQGLWILAVVVLGGSLLAVIYVWRVVEVAYFRPAEAGTTVREAPLALLVPTWALVLANFYFGIDASLTTGVAGRAAETLLGVGP
ncbi:MAG TPA: monovalent cation/H+ antiporter subunit D family protein [Longimicrobiales bacterium]|nr:monovalent cation/H+ antiporter subunit D family protein [Longimicrobiales bacterium]